MPSVYDKTGREIMRGDIVKVFHFIGARRKRHYMYKQCLGLGRYNDDGPEYVFFSHLDFIDDHRLPNGPYHERPDQVLEGYEIVQSIDAAFERRPRRATIGGNRE